MMLFQLCISHSEFDLLSFVPVLMIADPSHVLVVPIQYWFHFTRHRSWDDSTCLARKALFSFLPLSDSNTILIDLAALSLFRHSVFDIVLRVQWYHLLLFLPYPRSILQSHQVLISHLSLLLKWYQIHSERSYLFRSSLHISTNCD